MRLELAALALFFSEMSYAQGNFAITVDVSCLYCAGNQTANCSLSTITNRDLQIDLRPTSRAGFWSGSADLIPESCNEIKGLKGSVVVDEILDHGVTRYSVRPSISDVTGSLTTPLEILTNDEKFNVFTITGKPVYNGSFTIIPNLSLASPDRIR